MFRTLLTPYFNTKPAPSNLCSFSFGTFKVDLEIQKLKKMAAKPIVFVFAENGNVWAQDFISQFQIALREWSADGTSPSIDYIVAAESRYDLQEKLYNHPFLTGSDEVLVVSIGDGASAEVARFRQTFNSFATIAQLFCTVNDPTTLELVNMDGTPLENTTGVFMLGAENFELPIRMLKNLHGDAHSIGIVYDRANRFDLLVEQKNNMAAKITEECARQGLAVRHVFINEDMHIASEVRPLVEGLDALITLHDSTVFAQQENLANFCTENGIVLLSSELASVVRGAAFGYGNAPAAYVPPLIEMMAQQMETHLPLDNFRVVGVEEKMRMRHNIHNVRKQIPNLPQEKEDLLEMLSIYATE